jgi:hypothetical protein
VEDGGQQLPVPQTLQQEAAEVVAGALGVQQEQVGMMWMWGSQQLPQDTDYRYLGVQLSAHCGWKKHAEVLKDKCLRMKGMLGGVFRNKCLDSDVKRIMLLAVVRPVSGIWRNGVACQCPPSRLLWSLCSTRS